MRLVWFVLYRSIMHCLNITSGRMSMYKNKNNTNDTNDNNIIPTIYNTKSFIDLIILMIKTLNSKSYKYI